MPCTPSASTRLACSRHHASAAAEVKSTGEPLPIHHFAPTARRRRRARSAGARPRRSWARARGAGAATRRRADLAVVGVEVHPRRDPHHRAHAVGAHARDQPRRVRELVRVELPRVVLRRPGRVEHDRVERNAVFAVALEVGLDVALVVVDVAALPVPVRPLGQQRRQRARPAPAPAAGRRRARGGPAARAPRRRRHVPRLARRRDARHDLRDADLLLFCSETDTFGQVLLEAQASGLPVVAVRAGGPAELIRSGGGPAVPAEARALGAAVARLAGDPSTSAAGARRARRGARAHVGRGARAAGGGLAPRARAGRVDPVRRVA